ncbi:unknown [Prevotella sp. CAG:873]|nr:unknown [Prevotella sp. CAG:873]
MTTTEFEYLEKQKQIFFVTQRIEGAHGFEHMTYGLTIDCLLGNDNQYITLSSLSNFIKTKNIDLSPETLFESLSQLKTSEIFENFPDSDSTTSPFKLKAKIYEDFQSTSDLTLRLRDYIQRFLELKNESLTFRDKIIEVLLESIFYCNIKFLKHIVAAKEEAPLTELLHYAESTLSADDKSYVLFNELLQSSTSEFDEILQGLILRMFDFLSLNYNPKYSKTIEKNFGGKFYYLDSSFIIRLLGFDGRFRRERATELINLLSAIKGLKFIVHEKSIEETTYRIKELLGRNSKILVRNPNVVKSIFAHDEEGKRYNPVFELYAELIGQGKIRNSNDFAIYISNVKCRLENLIPGIEFDNGKLPKKLSSNRQLLNIDLKNKSDKSNNRIRFITSLLDYIDEKRSSNNYDISDIKYWLITTDIKTLSCDNEYLSNPNNESDSGFTQKKGICIMPSELIRMLDGFSGNIRTNHVGVFKNYMMKSKVFPRDYEEGELTTICKIATLVEQTNTDSYNIDEMVERVLNNTSISDIQKRLDRLSVQREKDKELIELFLERNEELIDSKAARLLSNARSLTESRAMKRANRCYNTLLSIFILSILASIINWNGITITDISTYFRVGVWGSIEIILCLIGFFSNHFTKWVSRIKEKYIEKCINKEMDLLNMSN